MEKWPICWTPGPKVRFFWGEHPPIWGSWWVIWRPKVSHKGVPLRGFLAVSEHFPNPPEPQKFPPCIALPPIVPPPIVPSWRIFWGSHQTNFYGTFYKGKFWTLPLYRTANMSSDPPMYGWLMGGGNQKKQWHDFKRTHLGWDLRKKSQQDCKTVIWGGYMYIVHNHPKVWTAKNRYFAPIFLAQKPQKF